MQHKEYHLALTKADLQGALYALVTGDPERVAPLATFIDANAYELSHHRGYVSYLAHFHGQAIVVASTGIGGPSTAIVLEELAVLGIRYFFRVGTTGALQAEIQLGDVIVTEASVRLDGASTHYAPIEYPAAASHQLTQSVVTAATMLEIPFHLGITVSSDTFYPGQERSHSPDDYIIKRFQGSLNEWQHLKALNYEMESATLFTFCRVKGLEAACFCGVIANRMVTDQPSIEAIKRYQERWFLLATKVLEVDLEARGMRT